MGLGWDGLWLGWDGVGIRFWWGGDQVKMGLGLDWDGVDKVKIRLRLGWD